MAGDWLPAAQLTSSGRPVLDPGEVESTLLSSVDLECEENPNFPQFKSGILILTTHRLLWIQQTTTSSAAAVAVAVPLNTITHIFPPKKSIKKMFGSPRIRFQVSALEGRIVEKGKTSLVITLVLRSSKTDPDSFYNKFWEVWRGRAWEVLSLENSSAASTTSSSAVRTTTVVGVSGILRREQELWESTDKTLQDAFQDLNALMMQLHIVELQKLSWGQAKKRSACKNFFAQIFRKLTVMLLKIGMDYSFKIWDFGEHKKVNMVATKLAHPVLHKFLVPLFPLSDSIIAKSKAKEMVMLAEKMRLKLLSGPASETKTNDEDVTSKQEMQDWLLSVGIASPVTKESAGALYHQQLSRQLADFVILPLEKAGGMIALIDVYCLFNRARGTELISPEDLLQACAIWEKVDVPVMIRRFDSGVMVIQNKSHSDEEVFSRIKSLVSTPDALRAGISPSDAARTLGIAPAMAKEHLLTAETKGLLCRDISPEGFRFFSNVLAEIDPADIYGVKEYGIYKVWISACG